MNVRALAAWSAAALTISLSTTNPLYRALVVLCALNLVLAAERRDVRLRPLISAVLVASTIAVLITLLLSHTGAHVLARIPDTVPAFGGAITLEALVFGITAGLGLGAALLACAPLSLVAEPHELVDALPRQLARTGAAIGTALNLMPAMAQSAREIRDAQRMRGWRARRIAGWPDVAVPAVLTSVESSLALAEAMESRAYGGGPRTHYALQRWSRFDTLVALLSAAAAIVFIVLRVSGAAADWYPFPTVTTPPISIAALACCAALIVPSLRRVR
ncbi:MAG: energy-coupling factor transporter transmembrane component T [Candidatus Dormibacteria bacterium]